jgi:acetamidase/formamidase
MFGVGSGFLPMEYPYGRYKVIPLDRQKMIGHFAPGIEIPLKSFSGSMGVARRAARTLALRDMIASLVDEKKLSRDDAYMLSSVAVDVEITQLVDGNVGVHAMLPKTVLK